MSNNLKSDKARRILSVCLAVLFALTLPLATFVGVFTLSFGDTERLAQELVDDKYLLAAEEIAKDALIDIAILYNVEEQVFFDVIASERETMRACAQSGLKSLIDSFVTGEEYSPAVFEQTAFEEAIRTHLQEQYGSEEEIVIREEAILELSQDCAAIVTSACAPIGQGMVGSLAAGARGIVPQRLWQLLPTLSVGLCVLCVLFLVAAILVAPKKRRMVTVLPAVFCGATLLFVPAFFFLAQMDLSALAVSEGVMRLMIEGIFWRLVGPVRICAVVFFGLGVIALAVSTVLYAVRGHKDTPEAITEADEPSEDEPKPEQEKATPEDEPKPDPAAQEDPLSPAQEKEQQERETEKEHTL